MRNLGLIFNGTEAAASVETNDTHHAHRSVLFKFPCRGHALKSLCNHDSKTEDALHECKDSTQKSSFNRIAPFYDVGRQVSHDVNKHPITGSQVKTLCIRSADRVNTLLSHGTSGNMGEYLVLVRIY